MLGAADVTNGVREGRSTGGERGWKGNKSDCISNRDFKGESFGRFGGGGLVLANGKKGTLTMEGLIQERGRVSQERKQRRRIKD